MNRLSRGCTLFLSMAVALFAVPCVHAGEHEGKEHVGHSVGKSKPAHRSSSKAKARATSKSKPKVKSKNQTGRTPIGPVVE